MTHLTYSFRANAFAREITYRIGSDGLYWKSRSAENRIAYQEIGEVNFYRILARGDAVVRGRTMTCVRLDCRSGQRLTLSPLHYVRPLKWEDRSREYLSFTDALLPRVRCNAGLKINTKIHWLLRLRHSVTRSVPPLLGLFGEKLLTLIRCFGLDRSTRFLGWLMRGVGPWFPSHRVARENLKIAFPEKSDSAIDHMVKGVWDNLGRVMAEYAFSDELCDYDPRSSADQRIIIDPAVIRRIFAIRDKGAPVLFFSGHLGSWELSPLAAAFGIPLTVVYRPFKSTALNDLISKVRTKINLVPARFGALTQLEDFLRQGSSLGMLVDQHFTGGVDVDFFGRQCKVNPTLATLARKYGCAIHGARVIRLPGGRFRGDVTTELELPRDSEGKVDIVGTMQAVTKIVEAWVREYPEQWLWLHRRWR
jgi:Kdo2-lipid IVA lauroyltransferase/acyltransferase